MCVWGGVGVGVGVEVGVDLGLGLYVGLSLYVGVGVYVGVYIYTYTYIQWLVAFSIPTYYKKNPSRPTQSHRIDYCHLLCNLVWGSAAVLEARCTIWKRTHVLFV